VAEPLTFWSALAAAAQDGVLTAVRWLLAPLLVFGVCVGIGLLSYDYYQSRTALREVIAAINNGALLRILGEQQAAQAKPPEAR
jgi:hypothetical protein